MRNAFSAGHHFSASHFRLSSLLAGAWQTIVALIFAGLLLGCKGESPVAPEGYELSINGTFSNVHNRPTIVELELSYDGKAVTPSLRMDEPSSSILCLGFMRDTWLKGHHALRITIKQQTISPSRYRVEDLNLRVYKFEDWKSQEMDSLVLEDRAASLETGQSIIYEFDK